MSKLLSSLILLFIIACGGGSDSRTENSEPDVPQVVSAEQLKINQMAFIELMALVRFFHPDPASTNTDWDTFAINELTKVERAHDQSSLISALQSSFHTIAPTVSINNLAKVHLPNFSQFSHRAYWHQENFDQSKFAWEGYISEVRQINANSVDANKLPTQAEFTTTLTGNIDVSIPLIFPADSNGIFRSGGIATIKNTSLNNTPSSRIARVAAFGHAWGAITHFYPYYDEINYDAFAMLSNGIDLMSPDMNDIEFQYRMYEGLSSFQDGHIFVRPQTPFSNTVWPLTFTLVESQIVVFSSLDDDIQPGDIVLQINGQPALEFLSERARFVPLAPNKRLKVAAVNLLNKIHNEPVTLTCENSSGETFEKTIHRNAAIENMASAYSARFPQQSFYELEPGYFYLSPLYFEAGHTAAEVAQQLIDANATGLVFDPRRGFSFESYQLAAHASLNGAPSGQYTLMQFKQPYQTDVSKTDKSWVMDPQLPHLSLDIAVIVNPYTQSNGETLLGTFMYHDRAIGVGETTRGANGVITGIQVMNNMFEITFTGHHVANYDGSQLQAIGIIPDVEASRTIEGIRNNRFEIIEAALATIKD